MVSQRLVTEAASSPSSALTGRAFERPAVSVRMTLALAASIAIVAGSPLVGALRQALLTHWPAGYVPVRRAIRVDPVTVLR